MGDTVYILFYFHDSPIQQKLETDEWISIAMYTKKIYAILLKNRLPIYIIIIYFFIF